MTHWNHIFDIGSNINYFLIFRESRLVPLNAIIVPEKNVGRPKIMEYDKLQIDTKLLRLTQLQLKLICAVDGVLNNETDETLIDSAKSILLPGCVNITYRS